MAAFLRNEFIKFTQARVFSSEQVTHYDDCPTPSLFSLSLSHTHTQTVSLSSSSPSLLVQVDLFITIVCVLEVQQSHQTLQAFVILLNYYPIEAM